MAASKRWRQLASPGGGRRWIGPSVEPTAPTPAKNASGEIVSARQRRARGGQQTRLELHIVAGRDVGRVAGRDSDPAWNFLLRHAVGADDADHHARADGPQVDLF